jgi:sugar lactone lactonase YvrE
MANQVEAPAFAELVDPQAEMTLIGSGYQFSEGPVWSPRDQCLYFSDIPGDARWRWSDADGMTLAMQFHEAKRTPSHPVGSAGPLPPALRSA